MNALNVCYKAKEAGLAVAVKGGKFQLQRVSFAENGKSTIEPITDFVEIEEIDKKIDSITSTTKHGLTGE